MGKHKIQWVRGAYNAIVLVTLGDMDPSLGINVLAIVGRTHRGSVEDTDMVLALHDLAYYRDGSRERH